MRLVEAETLQGCGVWGNVNHEKRNEYMREKVGPAADRALKELARRRYLERLRKLRLTRDLLMYRRDPLLREVLKEYIDNL